jgi:hypothetical protein
LIDQLGRTDD